MNSSDLQAVKRYALAYASLDGDAEALRADLAAAASASLQAKALFDPTVSRQKKKSFISEVFKGNQNIINLFCLLVDAKRINFIEVLAREVARITDQKLGVTRLNVTGAYELSAEGKKNIEAAALKFFGGKTVNAEYKQDKDLLGGVIIKNEDFTIDASISGGLKRLQETLR